MSFSGNAEHRAWLGLGGNIGDVRTAMASALDLLDGDPEIRIEAVSHLYRTPPWGVAEQPDFLNACVTVRTSLGPEALLQSCQEIEKRLKRERKVRWGPRTIDIDLLAMDDLVLTGERLTLPHPRMLDRPFVLLPLADIAPELAISGRSVAQWLGELDTRGIDRIAEGPGWWRSETWKSIG